MSQSREIEIIDEKVSSEILFGSGNNELIIEHDNQQYRLRITANGKLILTK